MRDYKVDFPSLYTKDFAFLDSGASAQKPNAVIDAMASVMRDHYANVHRGLYDYSQKTTTAFEAVREKVRAFINAPSVNEIVFTRNSTAGINLVAQSYGQGFLKSGDVVLITHMEHHANIVPWQLLEDRIGIEIRVIPVLDDATLDYDAIASLLDDAVKFVSISATSNATGVVNDVKRVIQQVKSFDENIPVLVDGSQSAVHGVTDVQDIGCDFFVFTGHKLYGPNGVGVLWGREDLLNAMPPYEGGGDMIETVSFAGTSYKPAPVRFEAGTPSIVDVIGFGYAVDYVSNIGMDVIQSHEHDLYNHARDAVKDMGLTIYGDVRDKAPILSFNIDGMHHSDIGMILNQAGVAVRTGHHCCMPLMDRLGCDGTVRASFALYNDMEDINRLVIGLDKVKKLLG